jgi:hypothetical protein
MKVICTGDRVWRAAKVIETALSKLAIDDPHREITIIHGAAKGADTLVDITARALKYHVLKFPALWDVYGTGAGPIRNRDMLDKHPDTELCLAFHDNLMTRSKGTLHMVRYAAQKKVPCWVYRSDGSSYEFHFYHSSRYTDSFNA